MRKNPQSANTKTLWEIRIYTDIYQQLLQYMIVIVTQNELPQQLSRTMPVITVILNIAKEYKYLKVMLPD